MLTLLLLSAVLMGSYAFPENRIINGTNAVLGQVPYIVSLQDNGYHSCGGSILDETHILTAAHCIYYGTTNLRIQYGVVDISNKGFNTIAVKRMVYHPWFVYGLPYFHDIAVLTLESAIPFSKTVQPTKLAKKGSSVPTNTTVTVAGWGTTESGWGTTDLKVGELLTFSDEDCKNMNDGYPSGQYQVCAGLYEGLRAECNGDSGGPLVTASGEQIGVVSWSFKPCGTVGRPGIYALVSNYVDWIANEIY